MGARLIRWLAARPAADAATLTGRGDRAEVLTAAHRWDELQVLADSLVREVPGNLNALRLRGVALAMRGQRAQAERIVAQIGTGDHELDGGEDRRALLYIVAALGDKARAMSLLDVLEVNTVDLLDSSLVFELLKDYPPFQERIKPHG